MKLYVKIALFIVFFVALSAILAALYLYNLKHTDMAKAKPEFVITATLLQKAFEDDETAASAKYINKILEVNGTIAAVKDFSPFRSGEEITVRGSCSGFLFDVLLNNCAVIEQRRK